MAVAGKAGKMALSTNTVADIQNWTLDAGFEMLEDTALLDSWKTFVSGLGEWSASAEGSWVVDSDTNGQTAIQTAFLAGTTVSLRLYTNSSNYYSGTAYITGLSIEDPVDGLVTISIELQGSGALSYT